MESTVKIKMNVKIKLTNVTPSMEFAKILWVVTIVLVKKDMKVSLIVQIVSLKFLVELL